jgi:hypothetical protein
VIRLVGEDRRGSAARKRRGRTLLVYAKESFSVRVRQRTQDDRIDTMLKTAVFAPMPSASVRTATAEKAGFLASSRTPIRMSWANVSMVGAAGVRTTGCARSVLPSLDSG